MRRLLARVGGPAADWYPPAWREAGGMREDLDRLEAHVQHLRALADWADKLGRALRAEPQRMDHVHRELGGLRATYRDLYRRVAHQDGVEVRVLIPPGEPAEPP